MKNKLFISGRISEEEVKSIRIDFLNDDFTIDKYSGHSISGIHDIVNIIFQDFNIISFTRDFFLSALLSWTWNKIVPILKGLRERHKEVKNLSIKIEYYKMDRSILFINFTTEVQHFDILIKEVHEKLTFEYLEEITAGKNILFSLDDHLQLTISVTI